jgi:cation diffusion facilitator family transporter
LSDDAQHCQFKQSDPFRRRERGVLLVVALTFVMMIVEITVGYLSNSMALLADGWHMATHVGALGITAAAYAVARRYAQHRAFTFGTGKVHALAGFTSAILLGVVALSMLVESAARLMDRKPVDYDQSLPVAIVGLLVNLASVGLLHSRQDGAKRNEHPRDAHPPHHEHHEHHDHAHRAALLHVFADAVTSALAIVALLLGRQFGLTWLDPATGLIGSVVIMKWSADLLHLTGSELLDAGGGEAAEQKIRQALSEFGDVTVLDLHVWPMGQGRFSGIVTIESHGSRPVEAYRGRILDAVYLSHLTVELRTREG